MLRRNNKYYNKLMQRFCSILTLRGAEIGEVPDEFTDKETLASQSIKGFEVSG